jgi:regulator of chromosome condensation
MGFSQNKTVQETPILLPELKKITKLAAGSNHALALDIKGNVYAWGAGQQNQLGRRVVERTKLGATVPRLLPLPKGKIVDIACGAFHCFAKDKTGKIWAWGLNNFAETGIAEGAGEDNAIVSIPTVVGELAEYKIKEIAAGEHHSIACTEDGKVLTWGRADGAQIGLDVKDLPEESVIRDERGRARIVLPTVIPGINAVSIAAGSDTCFAITDDGKAYSWGFSATYQTGQGTDEDIEVATLIENSVIKGKKLIGAGAGGQYGMLFGVSEDVQMEDVKAEA